MASIDRWKGNKWRARYRAPDGSSRSKIFDRKIDAERFLTGIEHSKLVGGYADPSSGRVTVGEWADRWLATRVHLKPKSVALYESLLRSRIVPRWGRVPLSGVTHADVVAWVAELRADGLSPQTTDTRTTCSRRCSTPPSPTRGSPATRPSA